MYTSENVLNKSDTDFRKKASGVGHNSENPDSVIKGPVGDVVGQFLEKAAKYYDQGMKKAGTLEKGFEKKVSEHPLASLLVAVGVGMAAGAFFNRR